MCGLQKRSVEPCCMDWHVTYVTVNNWYIHCKHRWIATCLDYSYQETIDDNYCTFVHSIISVNACTVYLYDCMYMCIHG